MLFELLLFDVFIEDVVVLLLLFKLLLTFELIFDWVGFFSLELGDDNDEDCVALFEFAGVA